MPADHLIGKISCHDEDNVRQVNLIGYSRLSNIVRIKKQPVCQTAFGGCEGRDRTSDLRVMSSTSYRCSTSRFIFKTVLLCPARVSLSKLERKSRGMTH